MVARVIPDATPRQSDAEGPTRRAQSSPPDQMPHSRQSTLPDQSTTPDPDDRSVGFLLGLLVGEGHFGGDGRQPQVTLRMHVRHEETFEWLRRTYPGSALYGPYHHGGRSYYQWSARGRYLREYIVPLVQRHRSLLDAYTAARFDTMCERYAIAREGAGASSEA